jgi:cytoskeletal protein CcmA (bactofilin family)
VIGEKGLVDGIVRAARLIVHGQVHGEIHCAEQVEIASGAAVTGVIEAPSLKIHDGARLDAEVRIEPPRTATVHVLRPALSSEASD